MLFRSEATQARFAARWACRASLSLAAIASAPATPLAIDALPARAPAGVVLLDAAAGIDAECADDAIMNRHHRPTTHEPRPFSRCCAKIDGLRRMPFDSVVNQLTRRTESELLCTLRAAGTTTSATDDREPESESLSRTSAPSAGTATRRPESQPGDRRADRRARTRLLDRRCPKKTTERARRVPTARRCTTSERLTLL